MQLSLQYTSQVTRNPYAISRSPLTNNWRHSYDRAMAELKDLGPRRENSAFYMFRRPNGDTWLADSIGNIVGVSNTTIAAWPEVAMGIILSTENGEQEFYDRAGKLLKIRDAHGLTQVLSYDDDGLLQTVTDPFGRSLHFTYSNRQLTSVTTPAQQVFGFDYSDGNFAITFPGTEQASTFKKTFLHQGEKLVGILDENGVRYATWTYNEDGDATSSEHAGGVEKVTLRYSE